MLTSAPTGRRRALAALLAVVAVLAVAPGTAGAHGDEGSMTVTDASVADDGSAHLEVGVLYENDDELAEEATVTALLAGPDGTTVGPLALDHVNGGRYGTTVTDLAPGSWTVTITSTEPDAEATAELTVTAAPTTALVTTTEVVSTAAATSAPVATSTAAVSTATGPSAISVDDSGDDGDGGGGPNLVVLVVGLLVVAAAGAGVWFLSEHRRR